MRRLIVAAAIVAAGTAMAGDLVLANKDSGNELRLYERPCSHGGTLGLLKEEWRPKFRDARIRDKKGTIVWYGCWVEENDQAIVIFEDGDAIAFPLSAFKDPTV